MVVKGRGKVKRCACACRQGTWGSGGTDPLIRNLGTRDRCQLNVLADLTWEKNPPEKVKRDLDENQKIWRRK
jgi:hypothetical protein